MFPPPVGELALPAPVLLDGVPATVIWIGSFTAAGFFPIAVRLSEESPIGTPAGAFWMFSIICVFALIFGLKLLPETKGRTLEEIAESWTKKG